MINVVLGSSYGDCGKGSIVNELLKNKPDSLVIRFNGGHQVGHTVVHNGIRHVFSNFGSGSLQGIPTYWSKYCTIHPLGILNENDALRKKGITPQLIIDPLCPVVTPFDIQYNRSTELNNNHGSVGVGFGATIARNETPYKLYAQDLLCDYVLLEKLEAIAKHYYNLGCYTVNIAHFLLEVHDMLSYGNIKIQRPFIYRNRDIVFEGGQGILLDQDFGFFPHVTRSNTTCKNALELVKELDLNDRVNIVYATRSYLTRHGNGPLPFEGIAENSIKKNTNETNVYNDYQKTFRYAPLNLDLLQYSLRCDRNFHSNNISTMMFFTCMDQVDDKAIPCIHNNKLITMSIDDICGSGVLGVDDFKLKYEE